MYAGKLRHRLTVQTVTGAQDRYGEPSDTWADTRVVWAQVTPLTGDELIVARQVTPEVTHDIRMRYGVTVTPANRLLWGTRVFGILAVLNIEERNRELQLLCKELV